MKTMTRILTLGAFLLIAPFAFACDYPAPPKDLPDGASASKDEMLAGMKRIKEYNDLMNTYLACIEAEEVVAMQTLGDDEEAKAQRQSMFNKKYNAAVDEQLLAVEEFNGEIREYKAR